ncbi:glycosyltransferase family 2 protein [Flavobacterium sp. WG21]|uniref:glycosyltransferase family 2 protein n=1 Tax=Flavobacterium sp. WG21 TaxID=1229487 RepID=UPI000345D270|nr:glycosyltransferase family 2 protein [Flavobacterium sp. WG21]
MRELESPMVSVNMITYGHENYIKEAIEGVLMQETDFEFDLIIAEDCSPDNTGEIIEKIIKNHPRGYRIKYFRHDINVGMQANSIFGFEKCQGKYIAICEGDDYWVDSLKLQKQVDFLEANPEFNFSMGRVDVLIQESGEIKKKIEYVNPNIKTVYGLKDYIKNPFSQTSSFVFRNSNEPLPDWFGRVHAGDQSLVVLKTGINGRIKYHSDLFSIYRLNTTSVTFTSKYNVYEKFEETLRYWQSFLGSDYGFVLKVLEFKNNQYIKFSKSKSRIYRGFLVYKIELINVFSKFI